MSYGHFFWKTERMDFMSADPWVACWTLGRFNLPNTLKSRQGGKGSTLPRGSVFSRFRPKPLDPPLHPPLEPPQTPWTPGPLDPLGPPSAPPSNPCLTYLVWTAFYEAARSGPTCVHVVHILPRNLLDWHAPTLPPLLNSFC